MSSGAFVGSCAAFALIMVITNGMSESPSRILLAGIAGTQLFNAMTAYVVSTSANAEQSRSVMFWLLGSLSGVRWPDALLALAVTLAGLLVVLLFSRALDTFTFGDEVSTTLGIPVTAVRIVLLLTCAIVTATLVSATGAVGFVGLVIPHVTRMLCGPGHRRSIPLTFLIRRPLYDPRRYRLTHADCAPCSAHRGGDCAGGRPVFVALLYQNRKEHP